MKEVKPRVPNPYHLAGSGDGSLPDFVPRAIGSKIGELAFISAETLREMQIPAPNEPDRSHVLECMRSAVRYQEESVGVLRSMLEQGGRGQEGEQHPGEHPVHHLNLFEIEEIDEVSINIEHNEKGETSDDFLFKDPTPPTR